VALADLYQTRDLPYPCNIKVLIFEERVQIYNSGGVNMSSENTQLESLLLTHGHNVYGRIISLTVIFLKTANTSFDSRPQLRHGGILRKR
jgi:hypothetical protein